MSDGDDFDTNFSIHYSVNDAVLADSNPPEIVSAFEFLATGRSRIPGEQFNL